MNAVTRVFFFLLLAVNLVIGGLILAPAFGLDLLGSKSGESERLRNQLHPDKIRVESPPALAQVAETTSAEPPPQSEPASVVESSPPPASAPAVVAANPTTNSPALCLQYTGMTTVQAQGVLQAARGVAALRVRTSGGNPGAWWVHLPPQGDAAAAERRASELRAAGVQELFVVQDVGPTQNAISLGLFRTEEAAKRQVDALGKRGVQGVRVTAREGSGSAQVELSGPPEVVERFVRDAAARLKGAARGDCASA
ncbi:MAG: SPOR domain-containing protein [Moraxellaceae bacterium]|nr:SPOR domain-containing protein [Moraxellaceae bacterium]